MGKMKQLAMMIEEGQSYEDAVDEMMEDAHYWTLVSNVSQWIVDNKSTSILDDISHKVRDLYLKGEWVSKRKKGV